MIARVLLGTIAALRAVLIPGQAAVLMERPLTWPRLPPLRWSAGLRAYAVQRGAPRR